MKNVKTNNKGFSLVELIIVIAIMAILIGVLAPQYMKYVEKSRVSADKDILDGVYNACSTAYADPDLVSSAPTNTTGDWASITTLDKDIWSKAWGEAVLDTLKSDDISAVESSLKSKIAKTSSTINIEMDKDGNFRVYIGDGTNDEGKGICVPENAAKAAKSGS